MAFLERFSLLTATEVHGVCNLFNHYANAAGRIGVSQLAALYRAIGVPQSSQTLRGVIMDLDADADGLLEMEDLAEAFLQYRDPKNDLPAGPIYDLVSTVLSAITGVYYRSSPFVCLPYYFKPLEPLLPLSETVTTTSILSEVPSRRLRQLPKL